MHNKLNNIPNIINTIKNKIPGYENPDIPDIIVIEKTINQNNKINNFIKK